MNYGNITESQYHSLDQCTRIPANIINMNESKMHYIFKDLTHQTLTIKKYIRIHSYRKLKQKHLPGDERPATPQ